MCVPVGVCTEVSFGHVFSKLAWSQTVAAYSALGLYMDYGHHQSAFFFFNQPQVQQAFYHLVFKTPNIT